MDLRYRIDPADNILSGRSGGALDDRVSCPVCGRRCSFLYVCLPDGFRGRMRGVSDAGFAVGCDRCVFVTDV